jgi:hypothetical protein
LFGGGCEHKFNCISEPVKKWLLFKSGRYSEVLSQKFKITINFGKLRIRPVPVDNWSLFSGVC